jgi:hypothetical protein
MVCTRCEQEMSSNDKCCKGCGELNSSYVDLGRDEYIPPQTIERPQVPNYVLQEDRASFTMGVLSVVLGTISYVIFGFMSFITLVLGIIGLVKATNNAKLGHKNSAAITLNVIGIIISAFAAFLMIILWSSL